MEATCSTSFRSTLPRSLPTSPRASLITKTTRTERACCKATLRLMAPQTCTTAPATLSSLRHASSIGVLDDKFLSNYCSCLMTDYSCLMTIEDNSTHKTQKLQLGLAQVKHPWQGFMVAPGTYLHPGPRQWFLEWHQSLDCPRSACQQCSAPQFWNESWG